MKKYLVGIGLIISLYVAYLAQDIIIIIFYIIGGMLIIGLFVFFIIGIWYIIERMQMIKASRVEKQKQSQVMVIDTSDGTWIRDTNNKASYKALYYNGPKAVTANKTLLLPETVLPLPVLPPIMKRLESSHQILISGVTGSGKTTLCQHLLTWLVSQDYSIVPCDIHSPGTVLGFDVIGSGRKFQDIFNALEVITETMHKRYNHLNYGKPDYYPKPIAVFMDELTTLVKEAKKVNFNFSDVLETLLVEGRKVNIKMVLSIHSLDVKTLGLTAGIRENNTMVQLHGGEGSPYRCYEVPPLVSIRSKKNWIEHLPPGPFNGNLSPERFTTKLPDARTIKIKNLSQQGFSPTAIARNVFNTTKATGPQIRKINTVLNV